MNFSAPLAIITQYHRLSRFGRTSDIAHVDSNSWREYVTGVGINAGILLGVGLLCSVVALVFMCAACCCRCCQVCKPMEAKKGMKYLWFLFLYSFSCSFPSCELVFEYLACVCWLVWLCLLKCVHVLQV